MLDEKIIELKVTGITNRKEALSYLADKMNACGVVKDSYKGAVIHREEQFPTALQFQGYGIAMPHTDIEHVNKSQIAVMTLAEPVIFYQMATSDIEVPVKTIIMLALKEAHSQLDILQKIMNLIQDDKSMNDIQTLDSSVADKERLISILEANNIQ